MVRDICDFSLLDVRNMRAEVPDKHFMLSGMREAKASLTDRAMLIDSAALEFFDLVL